MRVLDLRGGRVPLRGLYGKPPMGYIGPERGITGNFGGKQMESNLETGG